MSRRRPLRSLLSIVAAASLSALTLSGPAQAVPATTRIEPPKLPRGADVRTAHLEGGTVVDGATRVRVSGAQPILLGGSGNGYVLQVRAGGQWHVVRVAPGRAQKDLTTGHGPGDVLLSDDGETMTETDSGPRDSRIDVLSARTGRLVGPGDFSGYPRALDLDGDHVVVATTGGATDYNWRTGRARLITRADTYAADLGSDRLAYYTGDPYQGGCSVLTHLTAPSDRLWTSCDERVVALSPDGDQMITSDLLADGPGPGRVWERAVHGRLLGGYSVGYVFGDITWETDQDVLLEAQGRRQTATVRCSEGACERAGALRPSSY